MFFRKMIARLASTGNKGGIQKKRKRIKAIGVP